MHGKDEYIQAIQVLAPQIRFFGAFLPDNENAGGSAICIHRDLLLEEAIVTHLVTCHGRDHLVNIKSGRHNFVIVNVHLETELTLRQSRGRLRIIHPHWLANPNGWALFSVTSTSVIDSMSGTRHSPMATRERLPYFTFSFHSSLRLLNLITREGTPRPLGSYALFHELIVFSKSTHGWSTRFSLLLSCLWETGEADHSKWSRSSTPCHSWADYSGAIVQTHSKLDDQTSCLLFYSEAAPRHPPIFWLSVWRTCRVQSCSWNG